MILTWTPEFIDAALSTLTEEQRAAIHLASDLNGAARLGPVRLKRFGFSSIGEYSTALETARARLSNWFAVWGIHKLGDLDFVNQAVVQKHESKRRLGSRRRARLLPSLEIG